MLFRSAAAKTPPLYTWDDYYRVTDQEFSTPHWLRKGPEILAYLQANRVKPANVDERAGRVVKGAPNGQ